MATLILWSWPAYAFTPQLVVETKQEAEVEKMVVEEIPLNVEAYVRNYFQDVPVMVRIAKCESGFRQWDKHGNVLLGFVDQRDTGVMQINKFYHLDTSIKLGLDINTLEGNLAYARFLYEKQGVQPWSASRRCWSS